jgi:hypothetical protein
MDSSVVLVAVVLGLAAVVAGLVVLLRRRLPADVLAEVEAVAASIREALGDLATEERVRWMAGYVYDVAVSPEQQSRVSREEFEALVWQSVERWVAVDAATQMAGVAMSTAGLDNER